MVNSCNIYLRGLVPADILLERVLELVLVRVPAGILLERVLGQVLAGS